MIASLAHVADAAIDRREMARIAALAVRCLALEAETWPKPGLVNPIDSGSHDDMDIDTFRRSAAALEPFFAALADAGAQGSAMGRLRLIGVEAEAAMLRATGGVNTHRGAIFGLGLLCAAAGLRAGGLVDPARPLGAVVAARWRDGIVQSPEPLHSHGGAARRRFGAGGARQEAAEGFPTIYAVGLPALRRGAALRACGAAVDPETMSSRAQRRILETAPELPRCAPDDSTAAASGAAVSSRLAIGNGQAARVQACFALIAHLEDTNLLHRGGLDGLRFARAATGAFLARGGVGQPDWLEQASAVHRAFVARRLSPGGSADLLAMSLFVEACGP